MAATLLACVGAALIAGAPDWVTRVALAKTRPAAPGASPQAQGPRNTSDARIAAAEVSGSSAEPLAATTRTPPFVVDDAPAGDQPALESCRPPSEGRATGAGTIENCSRTLEIRRATA